MRANRNCWPSLDFNLFNTFETSLSVDLAVDPSNTKSFLTLAQASLLT